MEKSIKFIVWGIIITTIDLWMGPFNLIPSTLGYLLISIGVHKLAKEYKNDNLNKLSLLLIGMTIVSLFTGDLVIMPFAIARDSSLYFLSSTIFSILNLIVFYIVIRELIIIHDALDHINGFRIYTIVMLISTLLTSVYTLLRINSFQIVVLGIAIILKLYTALYISIFIGNESSDK